MNRITLFLIILGCLTLNEFHSQGLFRYFSWTAFSDGPDKIDHLVLDINADRIQELPTGINQGYLSVGVDFYLFHDHPINKKGTLAWAIGAGFSRFNMRHNGNIGYNAKPNGEIITSFNPYPEDFQYRTNRLSLNFVEVPFEIRIRSMKESDEERRRANFRLYLGFKGGYLIGSHTKFVSDDLKIKQFNIKNLLEYRYGPTVRIGFKKVAIHAFYSMTPMFKVDKGPQLYPFSVGLTWMRL